MIKVCFLDWDDSILCTHNINKLLGPDKNGNVDSIKSDIQRLEELSIKLIDNIVYNGYHLFIVTNAEIGWVELSGDKFMPKLMEYIEYNDISIISANFKYGTMYPDCPEKWKLYTFSDIIKVSIPITYCPLDLSSLTLEETSNSGHVMLENFVTDNLEEPVEEYDNYKIEAISIGDSIFEYNALKALKTDTSILFPVTTKTIKLVDHPAVCIMIKQLEYIVDSFSRISSIDLSIDIILSESRSFEVTE